MPIIKKIKPVTSLDDLQHEQAREIALSCELNFGDILPNYFSLCKKERHNFYECRLLGLKLPTRNELACGAIICYELTLNDIISFPDGHAIRTMPAKFYEKQAERYDDQIRN